MIGQFIGHYRIVDKIGQGGMGVVYLGEDTRLKRRVAVKALPPEFARDEGRRARFEHEARAAAALKHPGIADVYALERDANGDYFIVLEYVSGRSLREVVGEGPIALDRILDLGVQIADALSAAHAAGVVHRDLKPENVLLTSEGRAKLVDFGVARLIATADDLTTLRLTAPGLIVGTVAYASPEQLNGAEPDLRSDVFSFGVLLYELTTGVRPFEGATSISTAARILSEEPVPLSERRSVVPQELDRIVRKCLRKDPAERYQSSRELAVDLRNLQHDRARVPAAPPGLGRARREDEGHAGFSMLMIFKLLTRPWQSPFTPAKAVGLGDRAAFFTPRRWWEMNNAFDIGFLVGLMYFAGYARDWIGRPLGLPVYFTLLTIAAVALSLRVWLAVSLIFNRPGLASELRRVRPWLKGADLVLMSVLALTAMLLTTTHPTAAGTLLVLSVGGLIAVLVVEPTMIEAAFPATSRRGDSGIRISSATASRMALASLQIVLTIPFAWQLIDIVPAWNAMVREPAAVDQSAKFLLIARAYGWGLATLLGLRLTWRTAAGKRSALGWYVRWFPVALAYTVASAVIVALTAVRWFRVDLVIFSMPLIAVIPIHQRRLALKLLETDRGV